jgi:TrmH family RNA methyltransferase
MSARLAARLKRLRTSSSFRQESNAGVVFGFSQLSALLSSPLRGHLTHVWYNCESAPPPLLSALPASVAVVQAPPSFFSSTSGLVASPETCCAAEFSLPAARTAQQVLSSSCQTVVLDRISDPTNLGTILRTAQALRWSALLAHGCCDPYNDQVVRGSCGALFHVPWAWLGPGLGPTALSSNEGDETESRVLLLNPKAEVELSSLVASCRAFSGSLRLVVGNEAQGLSREWLESKGALHVRLGPEGEVLNAATAASLGMYTLGRF